MSVDIFVVSRRAFDPKEQALLGSLLGRVTIHFGRTPGGLELVHLACHRADGEAAFVLAEDLVELTGGRIVAPEIESADIQGTPLATPLAEFLHSRRIGRDWDTTALDAELGRIAAAPIFRLYNADSGEALCELTDDQARRLDTAIFPDPPNDDDEREEYLDDDIIEQLRARRDDAFVARMEVLLKRHGNDEGIFYVRWKLDRSND